MKVDKFLDEFLQKITEDLKSNLVGVYLHGSLAMGCFNPQASDIDLLIIVKEKLSLKIKKAIVKDILNLEEKYSEYNMEMSILLEKTLNEFEYPTPFELHYSKEHKEKYLIDEDYVCGEDVDLDLAAHIVVTIHRGICLKGKPIKETFMPIENKYFLNSILNDIETASENFTSQPVYTILNLCRVLYYIKEGVISSKKEGGEWGVKTLDNKYTEIVLICTEKYLNNTKNFNIDNDFLREFVHYMKTKISSKLENTVL
jgi:streptomycin 3"-adenylyltransferase